MNQSISRPSNIDNNPILGLFLIVVLSVGIAYMLVKTDADVNRQYLLAIDFITLNKHLFVLLIPIFIFNLLWTQSFIAKFLLLRGQGQRLGHFGDTYSSLPLTKLLKIVIINGAIGIMVMALFFVFLKISYTHNIPLNFRYLLQGAISSLFAYALFALLTSYRIAKHKKTVRDRGVAKSIPKSPKLSGNINLGTIGEDGSIFDDKELKTPKWISLSKKALRGNLLIIGSIGSGKTAGAIIPYLKQLLSNFQDASIFCIDPKGSFIPLIRPLLVDARRDAVIFDTDTTLRFNPLWCPSILKNGIYIDKASMIKAASQNVLGQDKGSSFWETSAFNLTKAFIVVCAVKYDYFTYNTLRKEMIAGKDSYADILKKIETLQKLQNKLNEAEDITNSEQSIEQIELNLQTLFSNLAKKEDSAAKSLQDALDSNRYEEEEKHNIEEAFCYIKQFNAMAIELKSSIVASATVFIDIFSDYRVSKIFCPKKEEINIEGFDQLIDSGKIILFHMENELIARSMGTVLKLIWQKSVLDILKNKNRANNRSHFLVVDEVQDVLTVGGGGATPGDETFTAKGREAGAICLFATQSYSAILNTIKNEHAANELLNNFKTKLILQNTDSRTIAPYQSVIGQEDVKKTSHAVSEQSKNTHRNLLLGGYESNLDQNINESISTSTQKEHIATGKEFSRLQAYEALAYIFDGVSVNFYKLFLKPHYLKANTPHIKVLEKMRGK